MHMYMSQARPLISVHGECNFCDLLIILSQVCRDSSSPGLYTILSERTSLKWYCHVHVVHNCPVVVHIHHFRLIYPRYSSKTALSPRIATAPHLSTQVPLEPAQGSLSLSVCGAFPYRQPQYSSGLPGSSSSIRRSPSRPGGLSPLSMC